MPVNKFSHTYRLLLPIIIYIKGDIQLRQYCGSDGCLKTGGTNKRPLFQGTFDETIILKTRKHLYSAYLNQGMFVKPFGFFVPRI